MSMFTQSFGHQAVMSMGEEIQLVSLQIFPTRGYHDIYRRSYSCQLTGATLNKLSDMINRMGPSKAFSQIGITELNSSPGASQMGLDSGGIIRYTSSPTGMVNIANGWGTQRARFILLVNVLRNGVPLRRETITGYTDYYGISMLSGSAALDPAMLYTIDSIKTEPYEMRTGVVGMHSNTGVGQVSTVLSNNAAPITNPFGQNAGTMYTARPTDVFTVADSLELINGAQNEFGAFNTQTGTIAINGNNFIADAVLGSQAKASNQKNDLPSTYTSRVLTNFYNTSLMSATAAGDDFLSPANQAMLKVKEVNVADSSFAFALRNVGSTCTVTGQFSQSELLRVDPTIDSRTEVDTSGELTVTGGGLLIPPTNATAPIGATQHQQIIAHMIANTFLSLMNTHGIVMCGAICDNYTGVPRCVVNFQHGLSEVNREVMISGFEQSMVTEVLNMIHNSGIGSFRVDVTADVTNQIYLHVWLNGEVEGTPIVLPAFARSALTPVVTNDFDMITGFAEQITDVVEGVLGTRAPEMNIITNPGTGGFNGGFGGASGANW